LQNKSTFPRRICMLAHAWYPGDVRVRREAETLTDSGFEVHIVCPKYPEKSGKSIKKFEIIRGVNVHRLSLTKRRGSKFRYFFEFAAITILGMWKLTTLHFQNRFDILHIHNMPDFLVFAGLLLKFSKVKLILDIHDPMSELFLSKYRLNEHHLLIKLIKFQEMLCYKIPDHLITVSYPMRDNVSKKSGRSKTEIIVVHNFPDLSLFPVLKKNRTWPYNTDRLVLLYSGTITEHYNLDTAVKAVAAVSNKIKNVQLIILGDGNKIKQVLSLARELGIAENVRHLEPVRHDRVKNIMAVADIGISTHQAGVFGDLYFSNKILEFMSQGLPILCSSTFAIKLYIPQDCIFYFEPGNVIDLVENLVLLYSQPGFVMKKIKNAKELLNKYSWQREKEKLVSFYYSLLQ